VGKELDKVALKRTQNGAIGRGRRQKRWRTDCKHSDKIGPRQTISGVGETIGRVINDDLGEQSDRFKDKSRKEVKRKTLQWTPKGGGQRKASYEGQNGS